ncbi:hypothetical protein [Erwinia persicina]|uniref:hypothetical protein n=1 Tax=Erwinia persicina TaxID=55211 RepID=UPI001F071B1D|nr:hypothetical protein [Erwinia persicina]
MGTMLGLLGLMLGAWAVRSICMKPMGNIKKVTLSLIAGLYFLSAGGSAALKKIRSLTPSWRC